MDEFITFSSLLGLGFTFHFFPLSDLVFFGGHIAQSKGMWDVWPICHCCNTFLTTPSESHSWNVLQFAHEIDGLGADVRGGRGAVAATEPPIRHPSARLAD